MASMPLWLVGATIGTVVVSFLIFAAFLCVFRGPPQEDSEQSRASVKAKQAEKDLVESMKQEATPNSEQSNVEKEAPAPAAAKTADPADPINEESSAVKVEELCQLPKEEVIVAIKGEQEENAPVRSEAVQPIDQNAIPPLLPINELGMTEGGTKSTPRPPAATTLDSSTVAVMNTIPSEYTETLPVATEFSHNMAPASTTMVDKGCFCGMVGMCQ